MASIISYTERRQAAEAELAAAKAAQGRDLAAALANRSWAAQLRDKYDLAALIDRIDEMARPPEFFEGLHAAADRVRQAHGRGRGRPKKAPATKPAVAKAAPRGDVPVQS
jgi:hypothetical protein